MERWLTRFRSEHSTASMTDISGELLDSVHAAHENVIWRQTKPIKRLPEHYRIRISLDYRMIVRWRPGKSLHILDVIPRQDLESWIKRHG